MAKYRKFIVWVISTIASLIHLTSGGRGVKCIPGKLYEGTSCATFRQCVQGRFFKHMWEFKCPPGTAFDAGDSFCNASKFGKCVDHVQKPFSSITVHQPEEISGQQGVYVSEGPRPILAPRPKGPPRITGFVGSRPPFHAPGQLSGIAPSILSKPSAKSPGTEGACSIYELDKASEYQCSEPGMFPYPGVCDTFSLCLNTMGCTIKGFLVKCPKKYLFSPEKRKCLHERVVGPCRYLKDESESNRKMKLSIQLNKSNLKEFFSAITYWDFIPFLPRSLGGVRSSLPTDLGKEGKFLGIHSPWKYAKGYSKNKSLISWVFT